MILNRKFIIVGLLVCFAGTWLILRPATADPNSVLDGAAGGAEDSESGEPRTGDEASGMLRSEQVDPSEVDVDGDAESDRTPPDVEAGAGDGAAADSIPTGSELDRLTLQTIPPAQAITVATDVDSDCDAGYAGLGVEFRAWGDVLLPYTPGYPTSEPGEVWDCTADTVFGGAIAMTHAAYLEALRPETIPAIAVDTPGRSIRIDRHGEPNAAASLGFLCAPIGWNWDGNDTWSLLHQCGEGEARVSYYQMEIVDGRWYLVYPQTGRIETGPPPEDYAFYPFIGGD